MLLLHSRIVLTRYGDITFLRQQVLVFVQCYFLDVFLFVMYLNLNLSYTVVVFLYSLFKHGIWNLDILPLRLKKRLVNIYNNMWEQKNQ